MYSNVLRIIPLIIIIGVVSSTENETNLYGHEYSYGLKGGTGPDDLDEYILSIYDKPNIIERDKFIENLRLYVLTLHRYIRLIKMGDAETILFVRNFFKKGGPKFVNTHRSFSSKEVILKEEMKFPDFDFQHYQYLRIDAESSVNKITDLLKTLNKKESNKTSQIV